MPVEKTTNEIRARVREPSTFKKATFKRQVIDEKEGISIVIAEPKGGKSTKTQAYRFARDKGWTITKAKKWLSKEKVKVV